MQEVTIHSLNTKLREINRNYPWSMPDWLKIVLMITSTIIGIVFIVVMIYLRTGNCMLLGKHLNKRRKSKSIIQHAHNKGIELKILNCPQKSTMLRPLSSTSTNNNLKSVAQRELPQLPNTSENLRDSPLLTLIKPRKKKSINNLQMVQISESPWPQIQWKGSSKMQVYTFPNMMNINARNREKVNSHYLIPPLL